MKNLKKMISLTLATIMMILFVSPYVGANSNKNLTIVCQDENEHKYELYQILTGNVSESNGIYQITVPQKGSNVESEDLLVSVYYDNTTEPKNLLNLCNELTNDVNAANFAKKLEEALNNPTNSWKNTNSVTSCKGTNSVTFPGLAMGYYLVLDVTTDENNNPASYRIDPMLIAVDENTEAVTKNVPSVSISLSTQILVFNGNTRLKTNYNNIPDGSKIDLTLFDGTSVDEIQLLFNNDPIVGLGLTKLSDNEYTTQVPEGYTALTLTTNIKMTKSFTNEKKIKATIYNSEQQIIAQNEILVFTTDVTFTTSTSTNNDNVSVSSASTGQDLSFKKTAENTYEPCESSAEEAQPSIPINSTVYGLGEGTYCAKIKDEDNQKTFSIKINESDDTNQSDLKFTFSVGESQLQVKCNNQEVEKAILEIPRIFTLATTGGAGTMLFYSLGSLLIAASTIMFIRRKRKQMQNA